MPSECTSPPAGPYLKTLYAWIAQAKAFDAQVKAWSLNGDKYAACVDAALDLPRFGRP